MNGACVAGENIDGRSNLGVVPQHAHISVLVPEEHPETVL